MEIRLSTRVTTTVYVFVVMLSIAVTAIVIVLEPELRLITGKALPLFTVIPFTVTEAPNTEVVGVRVVDVVRLSKNMVWLCCSELNTGFSVPVLLVNALKLALDMSLYSNGTMCEHTAPIVVILAYDVW